jgi:membrane-associated phospholipid phosphatase
MSPFARQYKKAVNGADQERQMNVMRSVCATVVALVVLSAFSATASARVPTVVAHIGHDIEGTFASWPAFVILGGAIAAADLTQVDQSFQDHFRNGRHLGKADTIANYAGEWYAIDSAALLTWGIAKLAHDEKVALTGETLVEALALTETSVMAMKLAFRRERPNGGHYSFPSGHAARTFCVASVLETMHGPAVGIPAFLVASFISFTRIDANDHVLSDVVFGAAWGAALGWGTAHFHKHLAKAPMIMPAMVDGVPGVMVAGRF